MLNRWTPAFTRSVPAVIHETAQDLADEVVDVALRRVPGATRISELHLHVGASVHYRTVPPIYRYRDIDPAVVDGLIPTGPTTAVSWIGDVRGYRTGALEPWWDRGDSLLLNTAARDALIGAAKVTVTALAQSATRDDAVLRVGLPQITPPGPTNVVPITRDSAYLQCALSDPGVSTPREVVRFHVPVHHSARELEFVLSGPADTVHALWAPALAAVAQVHDAARGGLPRMETVVNTSLRDYAEAEG